MLGYAGGFVEPLMMGWVLDLSGGMSPLAWGLAFASVALTVGTGCVCRAQARRADERQRRTIGEISGVASEVPYFRGTG